MYKKYARVPFTGVSESFHENGQLEWGVNFKNGQRDGLYEYYNENGQLICRMNFKMGKKDGLYESFYENGQLERRGNYKNGEPEGLQRWFNENGEPDQVSHNGDLLTPENLIRRRDGEVFEQWGGLFSGSVGEFYENGELKTKTSYKRGELDLSEYY